MTTQELARDLLIERIKAYMHGNPGHFPNANVLAQWYPDCLKLAQAIDEVTYTPLPNAIVSNKS